MLCLFIENKMFVFPLLYEKIAALYEAWFDWVTDLPIFTIVYLFLLTLCLQDHLIHRFCPSHMSEHLWVKWPFLSLLQDSGTPSHHTRNSLSVSTFRSKLKTHLFIRPEKHRVTTEFIGTNPFLKSESRPCLSRSYEHRWSWTCIRAAAVQCNPYLGLHSRPMVTAQPVIFIPHS